jgi:hypothetical protein
MNEKYINKLRKQLYSSCLLFEQLDECWKKNKNPFKSARASMLKHSPKSKLSSFSRCRRARLKKIVRPKK